MLESNLVRQVESEMMTVVTPPPTGDPTAPTAGRIAQLEAPADTQPRGPRPTGGQIERIEDTGGRGGHSRSGYAADKYPHLVDAEEASGKAVPVARPQGAQAGRVPPAQKRAQTHYEAVTAEEAASRASQRLSGARPPIEGGLSDPDAQYHDTRMEMQDSPGEPLHPVHPHPVEDASVAQVLQALVKQLQTPQPAAAEVRPTISTDAGPPPMSEIDTYMAHRARVGFEMDSGTYSLPAVDVRATPYGVIILLPYSVNDATFTPNPGTNLRVVWGDEAWDCFYPGAAFELPELGVLAIVVLRRDESG